MNNITSIPPLPKLVAIIRQKKAEFVATYGIEPNTVMLGPAHLAMIMAQSKAPNDVIAKDVDSERYLIDLLYIEPCGRSADFVACALFA